MTALEAGPLRRATLVLVGTLEEVQGVRDTALARVRPERVLKGDVGGAETVTVLVRGPRPTSDPQAPSAPYLTAGMTGRFVFFLAPGAGGVGYWLDALVEADGDLGREKVLALEEEVRLTAIPDPDLRARETLAWLLRAAERGGTWTRVHAARELNHVAGVRPDLFDEPVRQRIRAIASRGAVPAQRQWMLRALQRFEACPAAEGPAPEARQDEEVALADALTSAKTPEERVRTMETFLRQGGGSALEVVFAQLGRETVPVRVGVIDRWPRGAGRKRCRGSGPSMPSRPSPPPWPPWCGPRAVSATAPTWPGSRPGSRTPGWCARRCSRWRGSGRSPLSRPSRSPAIGRRPTPPAPTTPWP